MYRAAILGALATVGIHANLSQAFWCAMISATFVVFIPIEERQLLAARGERYSAYMRATPWRLLPGIW